MFASIAPTTAEVAAARAGDELVDANVVMDRAFDVPIPPAQLWPWMVQVGKRRGGWYLPAKVERWLPPSNRATHIVVPKWQQLAVGQVVPDWGGKSATFEVAAIDEPDSIVYTSTRGRVDLTWVITLLPVGESGTRVHFRLRLAGVRHIWLANSLGDFADALTVAGLAVGLRERLAAL